MRHSLIVLLLMLLALSAIPAAAQEPFLGEIDLVAFDFAPQGWAFCAGQILSISQNTALFSLIGTTYGGNGQTTFALPDLRGRRAISSGQRPPLADYVLGQTGGEENVTLGVNQLPAHSHVPQASSSLGNSVSPAGNSGNYWASQSQVMLYSNAPTGVAPMAGQAIGSTGGGLPHDIMPPYIVMNYIIALEGIFPSRD